MCEQPQDDCIINLTHLHYIYFQGMKELFSYQGLNYPFVRRPLKLKPRENPQSLKLHPSMHQTN